MTKAQTTPKTIDLLELANQIATTAKAIHKAVEEKKRPQSLKAEVLTKKCPEFKALPPTLTLFRVRKLDDIFKCDTLTVYTSEDGVATIYTPELDVVDGFEFVKYKSGVSGFCEVKHTSGLTLRIGISVSDDERIEGSNDELDGVPLPHKLKLVPRPETPLHSEVIPVNDELEIVRNELRSREFKTPLVDVKIIRTGEILKNVICNAALERILDKYGIGGKFKVVGKRPRTNKKGEPIDANGKPNKLRPSWSVQITDCQGTDFSDLEI